MANGDQIAQQMLAMAEYFRQRYEIRRAIKCSVAAGKVAHSDCFKILTAHQTGKLYHLYTLETEQAEKFLLLAYQQMCSRHVVESAQVTMFALMREYRLEAACMLAEIYLAEGLPSKVAEFASNLADSRDKPYLHTRLSFLCAEGAMGERKVDVAFRILDEHRFSIDPRPETVHLIVYSMVAKLHVSAHLLQELPQKDVEDIGRTIAALPDDNPYKLNIQIYLMSVQLANFVDMGMVRTSKGLMKQLQQHTQMKTINRGVRWADPTFITALVCVFTQTSMFQTCNKERATKYYNHAMRTVKDYAERSRTLESGVACAIRRLKMMADEMICQTRLINCELTGAMDTIYDMLADMNMHPALQILGVPRAHLLLGLVALYCEHHETAEKQFRSASESIIKWDTHLDQIVACSRGLLFLQNANQAEFYDLDDLIGLGRLNSTAGPIQVKVMMKFVHGFHAYLNNKVNDCRVRVQEIMDLTKSEDMFRMYTMGMLLFSALNYEGMPDLSGHIKPTIEWAVKSSDVALLMWIQTQLIQIKLKTNQNTEEEEGVLLGHFLTVQNSQQLMVNNRLKMMFEWTSMSLDQIFPRNLMP